MFSLVCRHKHKRQNLLQQNTRNKLKEPGKRSILRASSFYENVLMAFFVNFTVFESYNVSENNRSSTYHPDRVHDYTSVTGSGII